MERYSEYKDSGVQWLGEIPKHWTQFQFRKFFKIKKDIAGKEGFNVLAITQQGIKIKDITRNKGQLAANYSGYQIVNPSDFAMNHMDLITGYIDISTFHGVTSPDYRVFTNISKEADSKYYLYIFQLCYKRKIFYGLGQGVANKGRWRLPAVQLNKFYLPLPPLSEQRSIVSYLNDKCAKIDKMIEGKKKSLLLCKEAIESLIFNQIKKVIAWETCFPKDWNLVTGRGLFDEVKITGLSDERFLAVTQDNGLIYKDVDNVNFVTAASKETQKLICPGQFVISLRSFEGGIEYSDKRGLISPAYVVIKLKDCYDTPAMQKYYRFLFKSKPFVRRLNTISDSMRDGKSIKFNDIKNFTFPIPTDKELNTIELYVDTYDKMKSVYSKEETLLFEYKQRLISDVVTGQIKVC